MSLLQLFLFLIFIKKYILKAIRVTKFIFRSTPLCGVFLVHWQNKENKGCLIWGTKLINLYFLLALGAFWRKLTSQKVSHQKPFSFVWVLFCFNNKLKPCCATAVWCACSICSYQMSWEALVSLQYLFLSEHTWIYFSCGHPGLSGGWAGVLFSSQRCSPTLFFPPCTFWSLFLPLAYLPFLRPNPTVRERGARHYPTFEKGASVWVIQLYMSLLQLFLFLIFIKKYILKAIRVTKFIFRSTPLCGVFFGALAE